MSIPSVFSASFSSAEEMDSPGVPRPSNDFPLDHSSTMSSLDESTASPLDSSTPSTAALVASVMSSPFLVGFLAAAALMFTMLVVRLNAFIRSIVIRN